MESATGNRMVSLLTREPPRPSYLITFDPSV
jgi:hypothetical protein